MRENARKASATPHFCAFKPRATLFSVECAKKTARSRVACPFRASARFPEKRERRDDDAPLLKYTTTTQKVLKSWCRRFVFAEGVDLSSVVSVVDFFMRIRKGCCCCCFVFFFVSVSEIGRSSVAPCSRAMRVSNLAFFERSCLGKIQCVE